MAVVGAKRTFIDIAAAGTTARVTVITNAREAARDVDARGVRIAVISARRTFVRINTVSTVARVAIVARTIVTARGVGAAGIGVAFIRAQSAFIDIYRGASICLTRILVPFLRRAVQSRAIGSHHAGHAFTNRRTFRCSACPARSARAPRAARQLIARTRHVDDAIVR